MKNIYKKRKISIFTANRAEYGIIKPLIKLLSDDKKIDFSLIVSGSHLTNTFGYTADEIKKDKFKIDYKIENTIDNDSSISISKSYGILILSLAEALNKLKPDLFILLGDRYETSAAATTALIAKIPIAHLQGGEITEAAIDDQFRHSITKMSHYHFCFAEKYRKRVIQMGENPKNVKNYGALNVDSSLKTKKLSKNNLEKKLKFKLDKKNIMVTFHPETLTKTKSIEQIKILLNCLQKLKNCNIVFTKTNPDMDGRIINKLIDEFVKNNLNTSKAFVSLGHEIYINCLRHFDLVIGNSSSGIIETPLYKIPTVNLGERQTGRIISKNIINCPIKKIQIDKSIAKGLSKSFRKKIQNMKNPFYKKNTAKNIYKFLKNCEIPKNTIKTFNEK